MSIWTIVVAAGTGTRFGAVKQFQALGTGERVVDRACAVARQCSDGIVVVLPSADAVAGWPVNDAELAVVGGPTRSESVRAGLAAVPADADIVCVHDAARPLASADLFGRVVEAVRGGADAVVPAVPVADTIKVVDSGGVVIDTPDRSTLVAVQTPQGFDAVSLRAAHAAGDEGTDDAALVEQRGGKVVTVAGEHGNRKITEPDDLAWARSRLTEAGG